MNKASCVAAQTSPSEGNTVSPSLALLSLRQKNVSCKYLEDTMDRLRKSLLVFFVLFVLATTVAVAQEDELVLTDVPNGFKGTFRSGNHTLQIDSRVGVDKSLRQNTNSEGHVALALIRTSFHGNDTRVTIRFERCSARTWLRDYHHRIKKGS